jgi:hypothetical protein
LPALCRADAAAPPPPDGTAIDAIAAKLPPEVAAAARKWLHEDKKDLRAALAFSSAALEQHVMEELASEPDAAQFVLGRMAAEPAETVVLILKKIAYETFWPEEPGITEALEKLAQTTPDPDLMLAYMDSERRIEVKHLRKILTDRIAQARQAGDTKELEALALADERWMVTERGATIPGYMRRPAALFSVKAPGKPIRLVGMGDFGSGASGQREVAAEIVRMGEAQPFDFGLTFGDNFYPSGMKGTDDPRWRDWWEALYSPLGITFYPSLGNHEWYSDDGAAAEIAYSSPTWRLPSPYYTFTAGPVQFFALDTTEISEAQVIWLDKAIAASTSRWKVVYGHHPVFAPERNAKSGVYLRYMQARLWPVIRGRVDAYLCGHQHAMARMDPREGVHFFMSGGGGAPLERVAKKGTAGVAFAESKFGFLTLEADEASMKIAIFDTDGKAFDSEVITK